VLSPTNTQSRLFANVGVLTNKRSKLLLRNIFANVGVVTNKRSELLLGNIMFW
jgi:ADP-dependent phosphofructokinase/glucokinase